MVNDENITDTEDQQPEGQQNNSRRFILFGLFVLILAVIAFVGSMYRDHKPDFYAPGRMAMVNARMHFEESLGIEQALIEQQRMSHEEIKQAISELVKAENLDPADRSTIEELKTQAQSLEVIINQRENTPNKLHSQYKAMLDKMEVLINKLENHHQ